MRYQHAMEVRHSLAGQPEGLRKPRVAQMAFARGLVEALSKQFHCESIQDSVLRDETKHIHYIRMLHAL